ncbi:MAG: tRNA pseudouridine(55) synthase TruB, partial [Kiritimatiellae bacterium]|nr:tRNA pseudouridine(55) synthase TruB [Kiritimatiellia bacterium]
MLKPPGMSSSDLVTFVKRRLPKGTRVGHGGTLDPDAAGVLPVCVGRATRLFDYIIDKQKEYIAELRLGVVTDTQDATGAPLEIRDASHITESDIRAVLPRFIGNIEQIPPAFSAIKRDGKRMYDLARKGQTVELEARPVTVDNVEYLTALENGGHMIKITCRKGVYIRTICHDIGQALGVGGHMAFLLRNRAGYFDAEHGV